MGAWDDGPFDNDIALDFLAELSADAVTASRQLLNALQTYLAAQDADTEIVSNAIAAACVSAATRSDLLWVDLLDRLDRPLDRLIADPPDIRNASLRVLTALKTDSNEWSELWKEQDGLEAALLALDPYVSALT